MRSMIKSLFRLAIPIMRGLPGQRDAPDDGTVFKIDNRIVLENPTDQTALDIFKGTWTSKFPGAFANLKAGNVPLFDDPRIPRGTQHLGPIEGLNVLDLGPLEGGQAYTLQMMRGRIQSYRSKQILSSI